MTSKELSKVYNEVNEDIELYIQLHTEITPDLIEHCEVMTEQLLLDRI